jgi:ribosomal protein S18 acetylase RimI-like enzyme
MIAPRTRHATAPATPRIMSRAQAETLDMAVSIRAARTTDLEFLVDGNARMAAETEGRELDRELVAEGVAAVFADDAKGRYVIADDGEGPVGQLLMTREWSDWRCGWFWWIQSVYVVPEARGRGVYSRLYAHLLAEARRDPEVCGLRLYVAASNERAAAVYRRNGMHDAGYRIYEVDFHRAGA